MFVNSTIMWIIWMLPVHTRGSTGGSHSGHAAVRLSGSRLADDQLIQTLSVNDMFYFSAHFTETSSAHEVSTLLFLFLSIRSDAQEILLLERFLFHKIGRRSINIQSFISGRCRTVGSADRHSIHTHSFSICLRICGLVGSSITSLFMSPAWSVWKSPLV